MLINIDPILSPEVLYTLRAMGHGDKLILCDSNFPAYSMNSRVESDCSETPSLDDMFDENACELGSRVNVHVDIDPDDDDVFFSLHRQESEADGAGNRICPTQVQASAPTSVNSAIGLPHKVPPIAVE